MNPAKKKGYNFRHQTANVKQTNMPRATKTGTKPKNSTTSSTTHAILPQGVVGGAACATPLADTSSTCSNASSAGDVSFLDSTNDPPATPTVPPELGSFMKELKVMFRDFTSQVNDKLDTVVNEIASLKSDLKATKKVVSDLEIGLTDTSDRVTSIEKDSLPQLRDYIESKVSELNEKIILSEIHDRKPNLLVYGVPTKEKENVYETVSDICGNF